MPLIYIIRYLSALILPQFYSYEGRQSGGQGHRSRSGGESRRESTLQGRRRKKWLWRWRIWMKEVIIKNNTGVYLSST